MSSTRSEILTEFGGRRGGRDDSEHGPSELTPGKGHDFASRTRISMRRFSAASGRDEVLQVMVRITLDPLEALFRQAAANEHVIGHLRARRRKSPIVVGRGPVGTSVGVAAHDDRALESLQARGDTFHHVQNAELRLGGANREHGEILPVSEAYEDPILGRLDVELWSLHRLGVSPASRLFKSASRLDAAVLRASAGSGAGGSAAVGAGDPAL